MGKYIIPDKYVFFRRIVLLMLEGLCAITVFLTKVSLGNLLLPGYFLIFAQRVIFQRPGRQSYLFKSKVTVLTEGHILDG